MDENQNTETLLMNRQWYFYFLSVVVLLTGCKQDDFNFNYSSTKTPSSILTPGVSQQSYTQQRQVQMQLSTNDPFEMTFFVNKACIYKQAEVWEIYASNKTIELPDEDGVYEISVMFRNKDHFPSECQKLKVVLDRVGPVLAEVKLENRLTDSITTTPNYSFPMAKDWLSPIKMYQARVLDSAGTTEILGWTDIHVLPEVLSNLSATMASGHGYVIEARAQDEAGNFGSSVQSQVFYAGLTISLKYISSATDTITDCGASCGFTSGVHKMSVTLSSPLPEDLTIQFQTEDYTAYSGLDYFKVDETKQLVAGASSVSFLVNVRDSYQLGTRYFKIHFKTPLSTTKISKIIYASPILPTIFQAKAAQPLFTNFKMGTLQSCGIASDKSVYCNGGTMNATLATGSPYGTKIPGVADVIQVVPLREGSCALRSDKQVTCWDKYRFGTYRPATAIGSAASELVEFSDVVQFDINRSFSNFAICGVHSNGTIRCAGNSADYLLANGSNTATASADLITGFSQVGVDPVAKKVVMGSDFACTLTATGSVYCWGRNTYGQLGVSTATTYLATATLVAGLGPVRDISAGYQHVCAVTVSDQLFCWGNNSTSQLGLAYPAVLSTHVPTEIPSMTGIVSLALGTSVNCALRDISGIRKAYCWGIDNGTMGQPYWQRILTPQEMSVGTEPLLALDVGKETDSVCIVRTNGQVFCRGRSYFSTSAFSSSELGLPTYASEWWQVHSLAILNSQYSPDVEDLTSSNFTMCYWDKNKKALCHGKNNLADPYMVKNGYYALVPTAFVDEPIEGMTVTAYAAEFQCYINKNRKVLCRGDNSNGTLGDGTTTSRDNYVEIAGLSNVKMITSGWTHVCALTTQSEVYCWGTGSVGQLGITLAAPYRATTPLMMTNLPAGSILRIVAGNNHNCILLEAGQIYCWGQGGNGRLGNGTTANTPTPAQISSTAVFKDLTSFRSTNCAVTNFGALYCWGSNLNGAIGDGTTVDKTVPYQVQTTDNSTFVQVDTAYLGTCAVTTLGEIYCWGSQTGNGQLGDGHVVNSFLPVKVRNIHGSAAKVVTMKYSSATSGNWAACALIKQNGIAQDVKCWGPQDYLNSGIPHAVGLEFKRIMVDVNSP